MNSRIIIYNREYYDVRHKASAYKHLNPGESIWDISADKGIYLFCISPKRVVNMSPQIPNNVT